MNNENYKRDIFGILVYIAGVVLTIMEYPILGILGGFIGLYFIFTKAG